MARIFSFIVLLVILILLFALFFQVMSDFLLPMFLAVLLVIMFGPLHHWFQKRCGKREWLAALLTTFAIMLVFLTPVAFFALRAMQEGAIVYNNMVGKEKTDNKQENADEQPFEAKDMRTAMHAFSREIVKQGEKVNLNLNADEVEKTLQKKYEEYLTPTALGTAQFLWRMLFGGFVMILSLYYFLSDGPSMIRAVMRLSPLDDKYEEQLIDKFADITRAVIHANFLTALVQGILAGAGFYFAGLDSIFLLTVLAMLMALVPFIGVAGVWIPVCLWVFFFEDRHTAAIVLSTYCVGVSMLEYYIKPLVLHGRSNIHPLLALLSVLGGVQTMGPIGILVGPMAVAFLQMLLEMINKEVAAIGKEKTAKAKGAH